MNHDYTSWMHAAMDATTRKVIKKSMDILEDADKQLNSTELENLCHCWGILAHIEQIKHMYARGQIPPAAKTAVA